jgi:splicing factor 3B subunit 3
LAVDPKGRAIMIGAVEKSKFVYILNRDAENKMTISSPHEAHKPNTITFDMVGVDVGYENPMFAVLEVNYEEAEQTGVTGEDKLLIYYEMDLGLNHVIRKFCEPVDSTSHRLISVPGSNNGPGGVLVCCENFMLYKKQDHNDLKCIIP